jgi:hypothetical protein
MAYTTIDKPSDYFDTVLYTGNAGTLNITSLDFQPDWIWGKDRSGDRHFLADSVRGKKNTGYHLLCSNNNQADTSNAPPDGITAIGSNGFTLGANTSNTDGGWSYEINESPDSGQGNSGTYVAWNWKAGTSFTNDASSTGIGSIDSAGSVSTDAGFSIISYTGTGSAATVAHGLGSAPRMIIIKDISNARNWGVYHESMGNLDAIYLDLSNEKGGNSSAFWNSTSPTSSVFSINTRNEVNASSANMIAYCFAEKQGYSKFGSYTGNGNADGPFVYLGFKPAFVIVKSATEARNWRLWDNKRSTYNLTDEVLYPDITNAEATGDSEIDMLSNGFKLKKNSDNTSGETYIYMAFAESPFVTSTGVPATAR